MPQAHTKRPADVTLRRMASRAARMDEIIALCDERPRTLAEICDELVISENGAQSLVDSLRRASLLNFSQRHRTAGVFFTPRLAEIMGRPACARPHDNGCSVAASRGFAHTTPPTVTHEARAESGGRVVKVTTAAAPRGMFDTTLTPGTGAISQDNPGLAMLAARMAGIAAVEKARRIRQGSKG